MARVVMAYLYPTAASGLSIVARVNANNTSAQGNGATATWANWTEQEDLNNNFNATTGVFTAPATGSYIVTLTSGMNSGATVGPYSIGISINGAASSTLNTITWTWSSPLAWTIKLNAADTMELKITGTGALTPTAAQNTLSILGLA